MLFHGERDHPAQRRGGGRCAYRVVRARAEQAGRESQLVHCKPAISVPSEDARRPKEVPKETVKKFKQRDTRDRAQSKTVDKFSSVKRLLSSVVEAVDYLQDWDKKSKEEASTAESQNWKLEGA